MTKLEIASYIDHTLLAPEAGVKQVQQLCTEAMNYKFCSVCINPCYIPYAVTTLAGTGVKVCTVIGFPFGTASSEVKAFEACDAIRNGADEIDMVINVGAAMDGRISLVGSDIAIVVRAAREQAAKLGKLVVIKVIMETCFLDDETLRMCCLCAKKAGADFVKTSTGFANPKGLEGQQLPNGANAFHVRLMREAGATRIGTSSGVRIVESWNEDEVIHFPK